MSHTRKTHTTKNYKVLIELSSPVHSADNSASHHTQRGDNVKILSCYLNEIYSTLVPHCNQFTSGFKILMLKFLSNAWFEIKKRNWSQHPQLSHANTTTGKI